MKVRNQYNKIYNNFSMYKLYKITGDGSVSIATRCGMDGQVIESRWQRDFPHLSRPALRHTQRTVQLVTGLFRR
jgi:hypothetical protein